MAKVNGEPNVKLQDVVAIHVQEGDELALPSRKIFGITTEYTTTKIVYRNLFEGKVILDTDNGESYEMFASTHIKRVDTQILPWGYSGR